MKKILITTIFILPLYSSADFDLKDDTAINGKIYTSKSSSKFSSVNKCAEFAESKNAISPTNVEGFTYIAKKNNVLYIKKLEVQRRMLMLFLEYLVSSKSRIV